MNFTIVRHHINDWIKRGVRMAQVHITIKDLKPIQYDWDELMGFLMKDDLMDWLTTSILKPSLPILTGCYTLQIVYITNHLNQGVNVVDWDWLDVEYCQECGAFQDPDGISNNHIGQCSKSVGYDCNRTGPNEPI